jgi:hypothetical protein
MAVTAKVSCTYKQLGQGAVQVVFSPDYASGANVEWASATPSLSLSMVVKDASLFDVGQRYTLTFAETE